MTYRNNNFFDRNNFYGDPNEQNPDKQDISNGWKTGKPTLADMNLAELLKQGETFHDKSESYSKIGIRLMPAGLIVICRYIAEEHEVSLSQLIRLAQKHGIVILDSDKRIIRLKRLFEEVRSAAVNSGDKSALTRLGQINPFDFQGAVSYHTTLSTIWWVRGEIGKLSEICGISVSKLAIVAILISLATLPDSRGYQQIITEELKAFWDVVRRRNANLNLDSEN